MYSTRRDILYWERVARTGSWEQAFSRWNHRIFRYIFVSRSKEMLENEGVNKKLSLDCNQTDDYPRPNEITLQDEQDINEHLTRLKSDFNDLAIMLAVVNESACHLKSISVILDNANLYSNTESDSTRDMKVESLVPNIQSHMSKALGILSHYITPGFRNLSNATTVERLPISIDAVDPPTVQQLFENYFALRTSIMKMLTTDSNEYPLLYSSIRAKRPSHYEKFWLRNVILIMAGLYSGKVLFEMYRTGALQQRLLTTYDHVSTSIRERIIEPIQDLGRELFDTIRRRDGMVSREDLEQSRKALERMLDDFSKSNRGSVWVFPGSSGHWNGQTERHYPKVSESEAMEALMRSYEQELQKPVRGVLFGSLLTSMLIQMQKLKVHTEAAMLTMDQILASNELTIAGTAAMPAVALLGSLVYYLRSSLLPRNSLDAKTLHMRLVLNDVERSLHGISELNQSPSFHAFGPAEISPSSDGSPPSIPSSIDPFPVQKELVQIPTRPEDGGVGWTVSRNEMIARGLLRFNLFRLRSAFHEVYLSSSKSDMEDQQYHMEWTDKYLKYHQIDCLPTHPQTERKDHTAVDSQIRAVDLIQRLWNHPWQYLDQCMETCRKWWKKGSGGSRGSERNATGLLTDVQINANTIRIRLPKPFPYLVNHETDGGSEREGRVATASPRKGQSIEFHRESLWTRTVSWQQQRRRDSDLKVHSSWKVPYKGSLQAGLWSLLFSPNEMLSSTTSYHSINRDLMLLEEPDFMVNNGHKLGTSARMRTSYESFSPLQR